MLRQAAIKGFQALGVLFSLENKEEKTHLEKQDLDSRNVDGGNDRLKVKWFSEIPRCSFQCLYPPALSCGCYYSDFTCICRSIPDIAADEDVEACMNSCPVNPDQRWTPSRILDFCELVGEEIQLPEYMAQFAGLHRRQDDQVSYSDGDYYSDASYGDSGGSFLTPLQLPSTRAISDTPATVIATTSTGGEIISPPTSTAARSVPTNTASSSSPTPTTIGSASSDTVSSSSSSGLSTGAKAAIGVTIPLVFIILGLCLLWYFRKRTAKRRNGAGNSIPEVSQQPWPERPSLESKTLPAEADSTALHEPDSNYVFESSSPAASRHNPDVYELSGNSTVEYPPAAAFAMQKHRTSLGHHSSKTHSSVENDISCNAVKSCASTPASKPISSRGLDASVIALTDSGTPSQNPQVNVWNDTEQPPSGVENTDEQLAQLEAEMTRIAEERERLQQMQVLADKEAELKRQIAARKAANYGRNPESSP